MIIIFFFSAHCCDTVCLVFSTSWVIHVSWQSVHLIGVHWHLTSTVNYQFLCKRLIILHGLLWIRGGRRMTIRHNVTDKWLLSPGIKPNNPQIAMAIQSFTNPAKWQDTLRHLHIQLKFLSTGIWTCRPTIFHMDSNLYHVLWALFWALSMNMLVW